MSNKLSIGNPSAAAKLAAIRAKAAKPDALALKDQALPEPGAARERLRLIADDSGSMMSHESEVRDGVIEFFRNCIPGVTAAAVHLLCRADELNRMSKLNSNLVELASWMKSERFGWGGTPLFAKLKAALEADPKATRLIAFTDGSPTDSLTEYLTHEQEAALALAFPRQRDADVVVELATSLKVPVDTVFFGTGLHTDYNWETGEHTQRESDEVKLLKYISEKTGGVFMLFDPKKMDFKKGLKYLSSGLRHLLTDGATRKAVEDGTRS